MKNQIELAVKWLPMICEDGAELVDLVCSRSVEKTKIVLCEERTVITLEEYKDYEECNVFIRRQPDNTKEGDIISLKYLRGIHWGTVTGGVHSHLGNYYLMGYISEEVMRKTNIACTGEHKNYDRGIKVCIIRAHTEPDVVKYLYRCCWSREIATIFCREYLTNFCRRTPELVE